MSLVKELQRLTQIDGAVAGRVVSVSGTRVVVSTASGQVEVSANGDLHIGDLVTADAGQATKKQRDSALVYFMGVEISSQQPKLDSSDGHLMAFF